MRLSIYFVFFIFGACAQAQMKEEAMFIRKWFYCGKVFSPEQTEYIELTTEMENCSSPVEIFYWELKENKEFGWSDIQFDSVDNVYDGVIVVPKNHSWKIENNDLILGDNHFEIVLVDQSRLILKKKKGNE